VDPNVQEKKMLVLKYSTDLQRAKYL